MRVSIKHSSIVFGPLVAILVYAAAIAQPELGHSAALTAAITTLCACWWVLEPIPIPATSLLPLALLPLLTVLTPSQVAEAYGNPVILLLMGGCLLSKAMEKSGAHKKIAVQMLHLFGEGSERRVVFGFMLASVVLSMWISNTATTLMLLPVALAVIQSSKNTTLAVPLLLGICYSASIGGMGTPIGTPPNLIMMRVYDQNFGQQISFFQWMSWSLPVICLFLPCAAWWLTRNLNTKSDFDLPGKAAWSMEQRRVICVFAFTALAWMTRTEPFGGWKTWLNLPQANDASVALVAVVAMFIIPNGRGEKLLSWERAVEIPWGMLLLFSGGLALAKAFQVSGLAEYLSGGLSQITNLPTILMMLVVCLSVTFLTEVTSNTASTSLLMPILASAGLAADSDPMWLMLPAALSASCAFMLPVATAPNAVIYGSGKVAISDMMKNGLILNFIGAVIIASVLTVYRMM